ncbi:hypothetical protein AT15_05260 [Kosmotoga arenicorallina S304]|uniref:Haloacid dehalogenase n=1 Tax=Kosmotoga arenicorallina S304 TaxID=1453497 RepID=A0A176JUV8_9BACT|nr:HAD hydrolase-like protein [Kosmotoga arenicorallina]OAA27229.1 hypothetical protein AT15_05260 [Kosmotoga arenicorallina S304]
MKMPVLSKEELYSQPDIQLRNFKRTKEFLVAIDTDGCVTDNMNGKQILIFHPMFLEFYNLWSIETYFRETAEYFNLFSSHRGCNRFIAIELTLKALKERMDVPQQGIPDYVFVSEYIEFAQKKGLGLGNTSMEIYINEVKHGNFSFYKLLGWSEAVNRAFPNITVKIPPFKGVRNALKLISERADIIVVSQTPYEDLVNYWHRHGIDEFITCIAGQEMGSKATHIRLLKEAGGYSSDEILMIGDAFGDLKASKINDGLFYPVIPGNEELSWEEFPRAFKLFTDKRYSGENESRLIQKFKASLPELPPWKMPGYNHVSNYKKKQELRKKLYERFNPTGRLTIL